MPDTPIQLPPDCDIAYFPAFLSAIDSTNLFDAICSAFDIDDKSLRMADGSVVETETASYLFCDPGLTGYDCLPEVWGGRSAWSDDLRDVRDRVETTVGETLVDAHYEFAYPTPDNLEDYQAALHGELSFDAARNQVHVPRYWLDRPSPYFHAEMWQQAQLDLSRLLAEQSKSIDGTFTRHISAQLRSSEPPLPDLEAMAASLHVSQRTLNRRLQQEGSSYRQLKSAALAHWAKLYLEHTEDSVENIAAALGYQDTANFRRAFRKSAGVTPDSFRKSRRAQKRGA